MIKIILVGLVVCGVIYVMRTYMPEYTIKEAFKFAGYSITYGIIAVVAALVLSAKAIN